MIDGAGGPPRSADVLVSAGRIAAVEPGIPAPAGAAVLEAGGCFVAPGFIDLHSHGELIHALPPGAQRPLMVGRLAQGITTEIVGNCGLGVFPCEPATLPVLRAVVDWMTPPEAAGWPFDRWSSLGGYLDHIGRQGTWVNVGSLQPHGPLRLAAAGPVRPAGQEAARRMARDLAEALDAGAFGMSTGLIYPPGLYAPPGELVDLARELRRSRTAPFVASHIRGSSETLLPAVKELLDLGREAGVRVHHSHNEAVGRDHWPKIETVLGLEDAARREGVAVAHDVFPYTAAATMMLAIYPPWSLEGGVGALLTRLADPSTRAAIGASIESSTPSWPPWTPDGWPHNLVKAVGWGSIVVGSVGSAANRPHEGLTLSELGRARGRSPFHAVSDLMLEERGNVSQIIHGVSGDGAHQKGLDAILGHPAAAVCTDANDYGKGRPHPAACGAFTRVLERALTAPSLMPLQEAVRKMTGWPASLLGLPDRGRLKPGAGADLVVIDPDRIASPASFGDPRRLSRGVRWTIVNGSIAWDEQDPDAAQDPSGAVLRSG